MILQTEEKQMPKLRTSGKIRNVLTAMMVLSLMAGAGPRVSAFKASFL